MRAIHSLFGLLVVTAFAGQALGQGSSDDTFKNHVRNVVLGKATERETRKAMKRLAEEVLAAAHPSGANPGLEGYTLQANGPKSIVLTMSLTYYGALSQKHYSAEATIVVDLSDPDEPEVDKVEVTKGNNFIPPNQKNLAELKSRLNKLLGK